MTRRDETKPFSAVIGNGLTELRTKHGLRQEDVAYSARHIGLPWTRATVTAIELGRRELTAIELALLPAVLNEATGRPVPRWELVGEDAKVTISPEAWMSGKHLRYELGAPNPRKEWVFVESLAELPTDAERKAAIRLRVPPETVIRRGLARWGRRLDEERDQRLGDTSQVVPRTVQARRGHITRQLIAELEAALAKRKVRK